MDEPTCPDCRALLQRIAQLEGQVADLTRRLEDALRAGKRQAAPFRKGPPKAQPQTPGRKSGQAHGRRGHRPPPQQISECHDVPLPDACPHCQGRLVESGATEQFQTDIPRQPWYVSSASMSVIATSADGECRDGIPCRPPTP